jgi:hypothetical protein
LVLPDETLNLRSITSTMITPPGLLCRVKDFILLFACNSLIIANTGEGLEPKPIMRPRKKGGVSVTQAPTSLARSK